MKFAGALLPTESRHREHKAAKNSCGNLLLRDVKALQCGVELTVVDKLRRVTLAAQLL